MRSPAATETVCVQGRVAGLPGAAQHASSLHAAVLGPVGLPWCFGPALAND